MIPHDFCGVDSEVILLLLWRVLPYRLHHTLQVLFLETMSIAVMR